MDQAIEVKWGQSVNTEKVETSRLAWIDILRTSAALAVVALHVALPLVAARESMPRGWWETGNLARAATDWCVPMFVLVSGALLLDSRRQETPLEFGRKRMVRVLIPLLFWSTLYLLFRRVFGHLTLAAIPGLLLTGTPYYHLWFLFILPGLYAITPVLRDYIRGSTQAGRWYLIILILSIAACIEFLQVFFGKSLSDRSILMRFLPYIGYYLVGYQLRFSQSDRLHAPLLVGIIGASILLTALGTSVLLPVLGLERGEYLHGFFSPTVILASLAIFTVAQRCFNASQPAFGTFRSLAGRLAPATLGIYAIHPLILEALTRLHLEGSSFNPLLSIPLVTLLAFTISYLITRMIMAIPYLRRVVV